MVYRSSFSQHSRFIICSRMWFYEKIKKIPVIQDMCYAHAGNVLHKTLEKYYNGELKSLEERKEFFNNEWNNKKLDESKLRLKRDEYILMLMNGVNLNKIPTTNELKIYYPEVVAFLDGVDTNSNEIWDYKSSKRSAQNEEEYLQQLKLYCWLYHRKFGKLPDKATVYYLRYSGSKGELVYIPTIDDIKDTEIWYNNILQQMENVIQSNTIPKRCESCFMFCPYKNICMNTTIDSIKYTLRILGNYIHIDGPVSELLSKGLKKKFSYELKNAYFMKKANPYARTTVEFWNPNKRLLPIGFMNGLLKTLSDYAEYKKLKLVIDKDDTRQFDNTKIEMPENFVNGKKLRDYQEDAVNTFMREKIGMLEMGTGSGKTEVYTEIIRRLGYKSLVVVDKIELLRQTKKRIEDNLGIEVGEIGGGEEDIKTVTVATIQTLIKRLPEYSNYLKTIRLSIFDETHKIASKSYWKIAHHLLNTEYRLGGSGTAFRDDGNDLMITATTGYKIFDLSSKKLIEKGWLIKPRIVFIKDYIDKDNAVEIINKTKEGLINETLNYQRCYASFIAQNHYRNLVVYELAKINKGKKVLILTKLIEHGQILEQMIEGSKHLYGSTNKDDRKEMFDEFINGKLNVLISTISIFSEGIDIPVLDVIINAGANRGSVKTIQMLGRILRKLEGKTNATYYDFMDEQQFFRMASLARKRTLFKEGHDIEVIKANEIYS